MSKGYCKGITRSFCPGNNHFSCYTRKEMKYKTVEATTANTQKEEIDLIQFKGDRITLNVKFCAAGEKLM